MIEGAPGAAFEDEVVVRRLRWTSEDSGFAVIDAERDGDEIVLVGPIGHLEERERARAGTPARGSAARTGRRCSPPCSDRG